MVAVDLGMAKVMAVEVVLVVLSGRDSVVVVVMPEEGHRKGRPTLDTPNRHYSRNVRDEQVVDTWPMACRRV